MKTQCPACNVTLTRYEWSRLWWLSPGMSGRLVQPCRECGALLRLSAMRVFTAMGALGLIATAVARIFSDSEAFLVLALVFATLIWVGMASTRVEAVMRMSRHQEPDRPLSKVP
jgi:hypothetical protein